MKAMKIILAVLLLLCLTASSLFGCKNKDAEKPNTTVATEPSGSEARIIDSYPTNLFNNTEYCLYTPENMFTANSNESDVVKQAIFKRDYIIEEHFGIDIVYNEFNNNEASRLDSMRTAVQSGEAEHHNFISTAQTLTTLALEGYVEDLSSIANLELSNKWWSQNFNDACMFGGRQYVAAGPFSYLYYHGALCLAMNNTMAEKHNIPNVIEMIDNGTWTLDSMQKILTDYGITIDNSEGVTDNKDSFGAAIYGDLIYGMYASCGKQFSSIDANGDIDVTVGTESSVDVIQNIINVFTTQNCTYVTHQQAEESFVESKCLFMYNSSGWMYQALPKATIDYSIIPCPKYNEAQKDYITCAWPNSAYCISVPTGQSEENKDFTGLMMEVLCHLSYEYIRPAKYDIVVKYRVSQNYDTTRMFDIIFDGLYFDLNLIYDFGGSRTLVSSTINSGTTGRLSSYMERIKPLIDDDIEALLKQLNIERKE